MKYINIMGNIDDFDRVIEKYISKYDIQLEYTSKELADTHGVFAFNVTNPYTNHLKKAENIIKHIDLNVDIYFEVTKERALEVIDRANQYYEERDQEVKEKEEQKEAIKLLISQLEPFRNIDFYLEDLASFEFIRYRFGRMPYVSYKQFETFLYANQNILFVESTVIKDYVYGIYFVTKNHKDEADSLLSSFHFDRIWIPYELNGNKITGTPKKIYDDATTMLKEIDNEIKSIYSNKIDGLELNLQELAGSYNKIKELQFYFEARKFAGKTKKDFYIFVGWMTEKDAFALERELENDEHVVFTIDDGSEAMTTTPPTKLKNNILFRPFEFFVKMYGLPSYNEIDPTFFVALTYTLFFGLMFGDVGQGAVLFIAGLFLSRVKKMPIGSILSIIGLSSVLFGFMYGSVFGLEHLTHGFWIKPIENINTILTVTISLGVVLILIAMLLNIYNSIKKRSWENLLLGPNGISGIVFYCSIIYLFLMIITGGTGAINIVIITSIVSILLITFKEPISSIVNRKTHHNKHSSGGVLTIFEMIIEVFEILLSYFTNTISFVRVGAFALSHAGIMGVVMVLAGEGSGSLNPFILILGNIVVIGLEGLVVGIQALRLDFYEMFSRFFDGDGREFIPYKSTRKY